MDLLNDTTKYPDYAEKYKELRQYFYLSNQMPGGYVLENGGYDRGKIQKQGILGTINADDGLRSLWHFYNPLTGGGFRSGLDNAVVNAKIFWDKAIRAHQRGDQNNAYIDFGIALHHLEDMSSPAHVYLDQHWCESFGYENYWFPKGKTIEETVELRKERWRELDGIFSEYSTAKVFNIKDPPITSYPYGNNFRLDMDDFIHQMAIETYDAVKIRGVLYSDENNPSGGDLALMFPANGSVGGISYLQYVDGFLDSYWAMANVGIYEKALESNDWWPIEDTTTFAVGDTAYFYIEQPASAVPERYYKTGITGDTTWDIGNTTDKKNLCQFWAGYPEYLMPKTVEYAAGLQKFFHDIINPPPVVKEIKIAQGADSIYHKFWMEVDDDADGVMDKRILMPSLDDGSGKANGNNDLEVTVVFSKAVEASSVVIKLGSLAANGSLDANDGSIWRGTVPKDSLAGLNGVYNLSVSAKDRNNHFAGRNYSGKDLDGDPATIARCESEAPYNWQDNYGPDFTDDAYNILIDTQPSVVIRPPLDLIILIQTWPSFGDGNVMSDYKKEAAELLNMYAANRVGDDRVSIVMFSNSHIGDANHPGNYPVEYLHLTSDFDKAKRVLGMLSDTAKLYNTRGCDESGCHGAIVAPYLARGKKYTKSFDVESGLEGIDVNVWASKGSKANIYGPDGGKIVVGTDPRTKFCDYNGVLNYVIDGPDPGVWRLEIDGTGLQVDSARVGYDVLVRGDAVRLVADVPGEIKANEAVLIKARISRQSSVASLQFLLTTNGQRPAVFLYDDGLHGDGEVNDGMFANVLNVTQMEGECEWEMEVESEDS